MDIKSFSWKKWRWVIIFTAIAFVAVIIVVVLQSSSSGNVHISTFAARDGYPQSYSKREQIDLWIQDEKLNKYGDKKGTVYAYGSPLVDEDGELERTLLEYLEEQHAGRPWEHY